MRFAGRRPAGSPWLLSLLIAVFTITLALVLWPKSPKEQHLEAEKTRVITRFKIPQRENVRSQKEIKIKSQKKDIRGGGTVAPEVASLVFPPADERGAEKREGHYRTRKGDSLHKVSGRKEVYGDPLKWPSLFRLNRDRLTGMGLTEEIQLKELPEGIDLRFITAREARNNLSKLGKKVWVVNVLSSRTSSKIGPTAVKLIKSGYRVYITVSKVKEKEWMRLRAGFFRNRQEAISGAEKIKSILGTEDAWVVEIGKTERARFGGY